MVRATKQRLPEGRGGGGGENGQGNDAGAASSNRQGTAHRRVLRSRYLAVKNMISGWYSIKLCPLPLILLRLIRFLSFY